MNNEIVSLLRAAIECSIFLNPRQPGLTYAELMEVGRRANYLDGEISDAVAGAGDSYIGHSGIEPDASMKQGFAFWFKEDPEYRNFAAFDFIVEELIKIERAEGAAQAKIERSVLVARGVAAGIPEKDLEVAIACQIYGQSLREKNGTISFAAPSGGNRMLPSKAVQQLHHVHQKPHRHRAYPLVQDILGRRSDGRSQHVEPLKAFPEQLTKIGYGNFRLWWAHVVSELAFADMNSSPVTISVLAAALVEGALTFAARYARDRGLSSFQSSNFHGDPRNWKLDRLVESAAAAGILDVSTKSRAEVLINFRQRIHAGRMLSDYPSGVPDVRPEESRDAKATADLVVRSVIDWLNRNQS